VGLAGRERPGTGCTKRVIRIVLVMKMGRCSGLVRKELGVRRVMEVSVGGRVSTSVWIEVIWTLTEEERRTRRVSIGGEGGWDAR
jgi:hypothetical protein